MQPSSDLDVGQSAANPDPADRPAVRRLCHDMPDRALERPERIAEKPVRRTPPEEAKKGIAEALLSACRGHAKGCRSPQAEWWG